MRNGLKGDFSQWNGLIPESARRNDHLVTATEKRHRELMLQRDHWDRELSVACGNCAGEKKKEHEQENTILLLYWGWRKQVGTKLGGYYVCRAAKAG